LTNRCLTSSTGKVPEEVFSGKKVNIAELKLFGCDVMAMLPKENRKKLDKNSEKLMFIGYDDCVKGYRCINRKTKKFRICRNLKFLENPEKPNVVDFDFETDDSVKTVEDVVEISDEESPENTQTDLDSTSEYDDSRVDPLYSPSSNSSGSPDSVQRPVTRSQKTGTPSTFLGLALLCEPAYVFKCDDINHGQDPIMVSDLDSRNDSQDWKESMDNEYQSLLENNTWELVELPKNRLVGMDNKWS